MESPINIVLFIDVVNIGIVLPYIINGGRERRLVLTKGEAAR
jgi:hypothetical protein